MTARLFMMLVLLLIVLAIMIKCGAYDQRELHTNIVNAYQATPRP